MKSEQYIEHLQQIGGIRKILIQISGNLLNYGFFRILLRRLIWTKIEKSLYWDVLCWFRLLTHQTSELIKHIEKHDNDNEKPIELIECIISSTIAIDQHCKEMYEMYLRKFKNDKNNKKFYKEIILWITKFHHIICDVSDIAIYMKNEEDIADLYESLNPGHLVMEFAINRFIPAEFIAEISRIPGVIEVINSDAGEMVERLAKKIANGAS